MSSMISGLLCHQSLKKWLNFDIGMGIEVRPDRDRVFVPIGKHRTENIWFGKAVGPARCIKREAVMDEMWVNKRQTGNRSYF